jgi:hypothetical protein
VATQPYTVRLNDGTTQHLPKVWKQKPEGEWLVFYDEDSEIHRVRSKDVKSVTRDDMPKPERRVPRMGAV